MAKGVQSFRPNPPATAPWAAGYFPCLASLQGLSIIALIHFFVFVTQDNMY